MIQQDESWGCGGLTIKIHAIADALGLPIDLVLKPKILGNLGKADAGCLFDQAENESPILVEL